MALELMKGYKWEHDKGDVEIHLTYGQAMALLALNQDFGLVDGEAIVEHPNGNLFFKLQESINQAIRKAGEE